MTAMRYTGDGSQYLVGLPARDLTEDDVALLSEEDQVRMVESGMYAPFTPLPRGGKDAPSPQPSPTSGEGVDAPPSQETAPTEEAAPA